MKDEEEEKPYSKSAAGDQSYGALQGPSQISSATALRHRHPLLCNLGYLELNIIEGKIGVS